LDEKLSRKITQLLTHIKNVRELCEKLGCILMDNGEIELGKEIIARGLRHDNSKFYGKEWDYLCDFESFKGTTELELAIYAHVTLNDHHPEAFESIDKMPDAAIGELVVDWMARGKEFGRPIKEFLDEVAFVKYGFNRQSDVFKKMNRFYQLLTGQSLD
jgi:hypothetical protein